MLDKGKHKGSGARPAATEVIPRVGILRRSYAWKGFLLAGQGGGSGLTTPRLLRAMFLPAKIYFLIFGILTIAGGLIGYFKAGSVASIIAGLISGGLLIVAAVLLPTQVTAGLAIALIVSLLLAGRFLPAFFRRRKIMPDGVMALLSLAGIVFAIVTWARA